MTLLEQHIAQLTAQRDALAVECQPLQEEVNRLLGLIDALQIELREARARLKPMELPLHQLGNEIAAAVRAKPKTKTLKNGG